MSFPTNRSHTVAARNALRSRVTAFTSRDRKGEVAATRAGASR